MAVNTAVKLSSEYPVPPDPYSIPLEAIDVSDPRLNQLDMWGPYFKRLREEDPVHFHARSKFGPFWSVTRYKDVMEVDFNYEIFDSRDGLFIADEPADIKLVTFLHLPPPEHTRLRQAVMPLVSPRNLASMENLIRTRIISILEALPIGKTFDWVSEVSVKVTLDLLTTLADFPYEERYKLLYWTELTAAGEELSGEPSFSLDEKRAGFQECIARFMQLWQERVAQIEAGTRSRDSVDILTKLITNEATKDLINNPQEFISMLLILINGGNDTTRNTMSGSVLALNQFPEQYQKLRDNPALVDSMVPEAIRWHTPFAMFRRTALKDTLLGGKQIRKGDKVVMWYVSANRDGESIAQPDQFIVDRANPREHLAFGYGIHRCMGSRLAEMQLKILWQEVLKQFDEVQVVGPAVRNCNNIVRGIRSLPVQVTRKATSVGAQRVG